MHDYFQTTYLSVLGGRDGIETVRRLLAKLLKHELALTINWSGRNGKAGFKGLENLCKLIIGKHAILLNDCAVKGFILFQGTKGIYF